MRVAERLVTLRREPWVALVPLVAAQWIVVAIFALTVQRNGWLFYQGGDQTWFYTSGWELAQGRIPESLVGYLWPFVLVPLTWLAGPDFLNGLPAIVLAQVLLLLPAAVLCAYAVAARVGGRVLGYWAAAAWIAAPFAVVPLFVDRYHERWIEQTLPQVLGLTGLGDFPSMVLLMIAAVFLLRALDSVSRADAVACGLVAGAAVGLKPANGLFVFAPLAALAVARRWRAGVEFGLALVPALVTLVLWKYRGTGISVLSLEPVHLAVGEPPHPSELSLWERAKEFVPVDVHQLNQQFLGFREYFWSARVLEFLPVAGFLGVARRSWPQAVFFAVWLGAFFVVKGSSVAVNVETGSIWRLLMPAWPAYFFLVVSIPLLVPVWGPRLAERFATPLRAIRWPRVAIAVVAALLVVPMVASAALPPADGTTTAKLPLQSLFLPVKPDFGLTVTPVEGGLELRWNTSEPLGADTFFVVFQAPIEYHLLPSDPRVVHQGVLCEPTGHAPRCTLEMQEAERTRESRAIVPNPGPGTWTYRIGIAGNWRNDETLGDPFVVSRPLNVRVGR
jgi:hypothetical protein